MTDTAAVTSRNTATVVPEAMSWDSRARRVVSIYVPLACFVFILLFPFYWMTVTTFKPNAELYDYKNYNPFWIVQPTLDHIRRLLFQTAYPRWLMTTMSVAIGATFLSLLCSVLLLTQSSVFASEAASMSVLRFISDTWCRPRSCSFRLRLLCSSSACSIRRLR